MKPTHPSEPEYRRLLRRAEALYQEAGQIEKCAVSCADEARAAQLHENYEELQAAAVYVEGLADIRGNTFHQIGCRSWREFTWNWWMLEYLDQQDSCYCRPDMDCAVCFNYSIIAGRMSYLLGYIKLPY